MEEARRNGNGSVNGNEDVSMRLKEGMMGKINDCEEEWKKRRVRGRGSVELHKLSKEKPDRYEYLSRDEAKSGGHEV